MRKDATPDLADDDYFSRNYPKNAELRASKFKWSY